MIPDEDEDDVVDSDGIDDFDPKASNKKRKRTSSASPKKGRGSASPQKKRTSVKKKTADSDYDEDEDLDENQKVIGRVVEAPKTGHGTLQSFNTSCFTYEVNTIKYHPDRYQRIRYTFLSNFRSPNAMTEPGTLLL